MKLTAKEIPVVQFSLGSSCRIYLLVFEEEDISEFFVWVFLQYPISNDDTIMVDSDYITVHGLAK